MIETKRNDFDETVTLLVIGFIQEVEDCESGSKSGRFPAIIETFFALNPFPQCFTNCCNCFGYSLQHRYQEVDPLTPDVRFSVLTSGQLQYPGVWQQSRTGAVDIQLEIAMDLERRKHSLRDADGYIQEIAQKAQDSVRDWTSFPEEETLESGQLKTYIINCPRLHSLTSQILGQLLESMGQRSAVEVRYCI